MFEKLEARLAFRLQRGIIARHFRNRQGYNGNFERPRTYQEKVQYRKLYGNHAFYGSVADKYRVRSYVAERVGAQYLVPLLGVYDRLDASAFRELPNEFAIKANHGCKWNRFVYEKGEMDVAETARYFNGLLDKRWGWWGGERHYHFIRPKIVIEQLLRDADGGLPWNYEFMCYNSGGRFDYRLNLTSPSGDSAYGGHNGEILESEIAETELLPHLRPAALGEMVQVAQRLSAGFDFVRVDLYTVPRGIYFSELTCTPNQGFVRFENRELQRMRDEMWVLDASNPLLYCGTEARQPCAEEWPSLLATGLRRPSDWLKRRDSNATKVERESSDELGHARIHVGRGRSVRDEV